MDNTLTCDFIYLKVINDKIESFSNLYTLNTITGSYEYDKRIPIKEWTGFAVLNSDGTIRTEKYFREAVKDKLQEIADARYKDEIKGTIVTINGEKHLAGTDKTSRTMLRTLIDECSGLDGKFIWKFKDGTFDTLTVHQLRSLSEAVSAYCRNLYTKEYNLVYKTEKAVNLGQLKEITWE